MHMRVADRRYVYKRQEYDGAKSKRRKNKKKQSSKSDDSKSKKRAI